MEEQFGEIASYVALAIEAALVFVVVVGAAGALVGVFRILASGREAQFDVWRMVWIRFAAWVLLALEFSLAADLIRSAIAPTWDAIGKLAAIAAIRTALSFFLARDIETAREGALRAKEESAREV